MNLQELKTAAEAATPGPWVCDWEVDSVADLDEIPDVSVWQEKCFTGKFILNVGTDDRPAFDLSIANGNFIALANPANILKLIAVVELFKKAGYGNSTDYEFQRKAFNTLGEIAE